jgi:hydrogenase nickel incorporation protein HypA/HybF
MHELAVTESILDIVKRHAVEAEAQRVLRIHLVVGELSSIVDDSVQFYFDYLSQNTIVAGAELCFLRLPVEVVCGVCEHRWQPTSADWTCPSCGAAQARVAVGREFYVESIEVE